MTVKEKLSEQLHSNGMMEPDISKVIDLVKQKHPAIHLNDPTTGYPDMMIQILLKTVIVTALDYIDVNLSNAWYRQMFV